MDKYFVSDRRIILWKIRFLLGECHVLKQCSLKNGACVVDDFVSTITYMTYIAHLRQENHNTKFGIFELLVEKETFTDALLTVIVL